MILGPPDLTEVVESFSMPMAIRNYGPTTTTADGLFSGNPDPDTPAVGHYFPAKGDKIDRLELQEPGAVFEVHIPRAPVLIPRKGTQQRGSLLIFDGGRTFEVVEVGQWFHGDGSSGYRQCLAQEVAR